MKQITANSIKQISNELFDFNKMMVICYGKCEEKN